MLETNRKITCKCSKCGKTEDILLPQIISEESREKAADMSLFKWKCPDCGHILKLLYPCMYLNEDKKILIWFVNGITDTTELTEELEDEFKERTKGFTKRFCRTLEEFSEKIRVLEDELDDRVVELLKLMTFARLHMSDREMESIYYYRTNELGSLEFTMLTGRGPSGIALQAVMYEEIKELVQKELPAMEDIFYCIDLNWAGSQVVKLQENV